MCYYSGIDKNTIEILMDEFPPLPGEELLFQPHEMVNAMARTPFPALTMDSPEHLQSLNWILLPPWFKKKEDLKTQKIWSANIRIEEAEQKRTYKSLLETSRCIVFFSHFFEWEHRGKEKIKHKVSLAEGRIMILPGLYSTVNLEGERYCSFALCTMEARGIMRTIHNTKLRQPVVINEQGAAHWLNPDLNFPAARKKVLACELSGNFMSSENF